MSGPEYWRFTYAERRQMSLETDRLPMRCQSAECRPDAPACRQAERRILVSLPPVSARRRRRVGSHTRAIRGQRDKRRQ